MLPSEVNTQLFIHHMTYGCVVRAKYIAQNCVRFIIIYTPSL